MLRLTQPSVTPPTRQDKRRKLSTVKYFPAKLPEAAGKEVAGNDTVVGEQQLRAEPQILAAEASAPAAMVAGEQQLRAEPQVLAAEASAPAATVAGEQQLRVES